MNFMNFSTFSAYLDVCLFVLFVQMSQANAFKGAKLLFGVKNWIFNEISMIFMIFFSEFSKNYHPFWWPTSLKVAQSLHPQSVPFSGIVRLQPVLVPFWKCLKSMRLKKSEKSMESSWKYGRNPPKITRN